MRIENIKRAELIVSILLTLMIASLLIVRATHAGALWRDECGALQLARMASVSDIFANFQHEAFPPPFPLTLRAYTSLFGTSDAALRGFGFAVGLGFLCVAWVNARLLGEKVPLLFLALLGLNTTFLMWGTSVRGYGLGSVLIALAFGLGGRVIVDPAPRWIFAALFVCIASVQFLINDIVLVFSLAFAGMAVCVIGKRVKLVVVFLTAAVLATLSILPYFKSYSDSAAWNIVLRYPGHLDWLWGNLNYALGGHVRIMPWIWYILMAFAIVGVAWRWIVLRANSSALLMFGLLVALGSIIAYFVFLQWLSYVTQPWYYLAPLFVLAAALDLSVAQLSDIAWIRMTRLALVIALLLALPFAVWPVIIKRQTNVDLIAQKLEREANGVDLIVVNPWINGVSFNWYYHGATLWLTVPTMNEHRVHRYDLLRAKMMSADPLADLFDAIRSTLQSGHRVWLVGGAEILPEGQTPLALPPAPQSQFSWESDAYLVSWSQQLANFLQTHATNAQIILDKSATVNDQENLPLWLAQGWRD